MNHQIDQKDSEHYYDDRIDLRSLFPIFWNHKKFILLLTAFFAICSVVYSLTLTNIYTSQTLLRPTSESNSGLLNQYGGIASLAGINIPKATVDEVGVAMAMVNSKKLVSQLMLHESFLPDLMAAKKWNTETNTIFYDDDLYDKTNKKWIRKVSSNRQQIPSPQEAILSFSQLVTISQDTNNSLVTLSVDHMSPHVAHQWSLWIVKEINILLANMKVIESQASIDYLNNQIKITPYAELKTMFYELIQESTQSMMLAKVNPEYVLTTIDPPIVAEIKSKPNRSLTCILGTILGFIISIVIVLIRYLGFSKTNEDDIFSIINFYNCIDKFKIIYKRVPEA